MQVRPDSCSEYSAGSQRRIYVSAAVRSVEAKVLVKVMFISLLVSPARRVSSSFVEFVSKRFVCFRLNVG